MYSVIFKSRTNVVFLQQRSWIMQGYRNRSDMPAAENHMIGGGGGTNSSLVESIAAEWRTAKPFESIPGPTRFQMIRGFMKWGPLGRGPILSIFDPKDFERVHRTEGPYPVRPAGEAVIFYRERRKDNFFKDTIGLAGNGKSWSDFRSKVNPILMKPQNARLYLDPMSRVSNQFIRRIQKIRDPVTHEVPDNFFNDINRLSLESVAVVALDKELGLISGEVNSTDTHKMFECTQILFDSIYELDFKPSLYHYFPTPTYKRFERALDTIFQICSRHINEAVQHLDEREKEGKDIGEDATERSVLEKLLKIDRKVAMIMALDMLESGVDTTSMVLVAALLLIAKNPEKQLKLRTEIMNAIGQDGCFTIENMNNLPYLRACIKEALRIYPIASGNSRQTGRDIVLKGYRVPEGTRVLINSNLLLSEEKYFPRPHEFIPERWLRGQKFEGLIAKDLSPFLFLPFGFGPRSCVGKRIVDLEAELTLTSLVRKFSIEFNYPIDNWCVNKLINYPRIPLKFKFTDL